MASNDPSSLVNDSPNNRKSNSSLGAESSAPAELSAVVDELLNTLSNKFAGVSSEIFAKMDDMSRRLDNLEAQLTSGAQGNDAKSSPTKLQ